MDTEDCFASSDPDLESLQLALHLECIGENRFLSSHLSPNMNGVVFGGQLLANSLTAAMLTVPDRPPHFLQACFLNPTSLEHPLELSVERVRDGRSFSHRHVDIFQHGKRILTTEVSFHDGAIGPEHETSPCSNVPEPESLEELADIISRFETRISARVQARMLTRRSVLLKPVDPEGALVRPTSSPRIAAWIKLVHAMPTNPLSRYAAVAFLSDYWLAGGCLCSHTNSVFEENALLISVNHGIWFHRDPIVNDWLLYDIESPVARNGLGVSRGLLYDRRRHLLASTLQQVLVRP